MSSPSSGSFVGRSLLELEGILDASGLAEMVEPAMPSGGRPRQLPVRTLVLGFLLATADDRPAHLTRVHAALVSLPDAEKARLKIAVSRRGRPHELTYRQVEHTGRSLRAVFDAERLDGKPGQLLTQVTEALVEASIPEALGAEGDLAVDWTDVESFARPGRGGRPSSDRDASFGHRRGDAPGQGHEVFLATTSSSRRWCARSAGHRHPSSSAASS